MVDYLLGYEERKKGKKSVMRFEVEDTGTGKVQEFSFFEGYMNPKQDEVRKEKTGRNRSGAFIT